METRDFVLANDLPLLSVVLINQCSFYPGRHHILLTGEFSAVVCLERLLELLLSEQQARRG